MACCGLRLGLFDLFFFLEVLELLNCAGNVQRCEGFFVIAAFWVNSGRTLTPHTLMVFFKVYRFFSNMQVFLYYYLLKLSDFSLHYALNGNVAIGIECLKCSDYLSFYSLLINVFFFSLTTNLLRSVWFLKQHHIFCFCFSIFTKCCSTFLLE